MKEINEQLNKIHFLVCSDCQGIGEKEGHVCAACQGMGVVGFWNNKIYYCGLKLSLFTIGLNNLKRLYDSLINLVSLLIGLAGFAFLAWWIKETAQTYGSQAVFDFWQTQDWRLLLFWLSVVADMFAIYRLFEGGRIKRKIVPLPLSKISSFQPQSISWRELSKFKDKDKIDVSRSFSREFFKTVEEAYVFAHSLGFRQVLVKHFFVEALKINEVVALFSRLVIYAPDLAKKIVEFLSFSKMSGQSLTKDLFLQPGQQIIISAEVKKLFIKSYIQARLLEQDQVEPLNSLVPAVEEDTDIAELLYDLDVDKQKILNVIYWFKINKEIIKSYQQYRHLARFKPATHMDRAYTAVATPVLDHFGYDLTIAAKWSKLEFCVAREAEIKDIFTRLQGGHAGIILVGDKGVGKRTIIHGIAQLMVKEEVPDILKDKRLVELDVARLISGAAGAAAQNRLLVALDEARRAGNVVLAINDVENIIGVSAGAEESLDLSEVLADALSRHSIYCFATATTANYTRYIKDKALGEAMDKVEIQEPQGNKAIVIVSSKIGFFEAKYNVFYSYRALSASIDLSSRYMHDKYLPAKAIEVLELAGARAAESGEKEHKFIKKSDITEVVSQLTHIPVETAAEEEGKKLLKLEEKIHEQMIDQDEAVKMVAASLRRARAQMRPGKRPIASFLFMGPTGVGKTQLAKTLAAQYFGDEKAMIRVDMSEYQHPDSIKKMIGDAEGALGYLTEAVRRSPFSIVLLDEFEKAYAGILDLFLQVMDDGRLTDGQGRTVDFTNCIIIATSNVGAVFIQDEIKKGTSIETIKEELINNHLNKYLRPELLNRFDGIVVFKPLSAEDVVAITKLMLKNIAKLLEKKGISLRAEEKGVRLLAQLGFDPKFGARPLRRLLQEKVENIIANKILAGELERRDTVIIDEQAQIKIEKGREL